MNSYNLRDKANTPKNNYAFIDGHNLYRSSLHWGWKLDYSKFLKFLQVKYSITTAYLFMGYRSENNEAYINLQKQGFILVFKDTTEKEEEIKGNSDVELVLQSLVEINQYDKAVIVTGDGDFGALVRYLNTVDKLEALLIPSDSFVPSILKRTAREKISYLNNLKSELASHSFYYNVPTILPNASSNSIASEQRKPINSQLRRNTYPSIGGNRLNISDVKILETDTKSDTKTEVLDKKSQLLEAVKQAKLKSQEIVVTHKAVINSQLITSFSKPEVLEKKLEIKSEIREVKTSLPVIATVTTPVAPRKAVINSSLPEDATKKIQNIVDNLMSVALLADDDLDKIEKKVYKPRLKRKQQNSDEEIKHNSIDSQDNNVSKPSIHIE